ncbi:MAG TPA: glycosyltransferase family 4 protein [Candidatus Paceibacterota bacterium]|nr:glycosyltransferase family 4 protein [Candidatus Paceibacterota bacterium]
MALKVLMFGWEFPPHNSGGLGVACKGLVKGLSREGVNITFVLPRRVETDMSDAKFLFADIKNVDVVEVGSSLRPYVTPEGYARVWSHEEDDKIYGNTLAEEVYRYARKAREIALREDFDLIHAHDWLSFLAGIEAKRATGKPLVIHVHATGWDQCGGGNIDPTIYAIEQRGMQEADCIIAVSNWTKRVMVEHYGVPESKIKVVHNGIDAEDYDRVQVPKIEAFKRAGYKAVLFVGRITIQKGPDYFIKLARRVLEFAPKTIFVMSGSGDMEAQVMREAAAYGVSDKFVFTGFLRGKELQAVYQMADIYILPSVSEPFGITPLESLLNGTPVLVSKQSGVSEVLTHALVADFWDIDSMTDQVLSVLEHDSLRGTLRENGKQNILGITWKSAAEKCKLVYESMMEHFSGLQSAHGAL